jgi:hypothetical protein
MFRKEKRNREKKMNAADIAIQEASCFSIDFPNAFEQIPELIEKLKSNRSEIRISGIKSLWQIVTVRWFGSDLDQFLNDLVSELFEIVCNYHHIEEHDEALRLISVLSIHSLHKFDQYACFLLDQISPLLSGSTHEESLRFYVVAVLVSFSVEEENKIIETLKQFIEFYVNKKSRAEVFSKRVLKTILQGIIMMMSSVESKISAENLFSQIENVLIIALQSTEYSILVQALHLIGAIHSCFLDFEDGKSSDEIELQQHTSKSFANSNISRINKLSNNLNSKSQSKNLKSICNEHIQFLEMKGPQQKININQQDIYFEGYRKCVLLNALHEILLSNLQSVLIHNLYLQELFDFVLKSNLQMARFFKKNKKTIKHNRLESIKERKMELSNQRKKKELFDQAEDE